MSKIDAPTFECPIPMIAPLGLEVTAAGVREVWDVYVKAMANPDEFAPQSVEERTLRAILRAVHHGLEVHEASTEVAS